VFSGLPDTYFVHDGVGLGMVRAGEPRLRPDSRAALARVTAALRVPEALRVATSR
jgi:hypothetical protein